MTFAEAVKLAQTKCVMIYPERRKEWEEGMFWTGSEWLCWPPNGAGDFVPTDFTMEEILGNWVRVSPTDLGFTSKKLAEFVAAWREADEEERKAQAIRKQAIYELTLAARELAHAHEEEGVRLISVGIVQSCTDDNTTLFPSAA